MGNTQRTLWIDSIDLERLNGKTWIPTTIQYTADRDPAIGPSIYPSDPVVSAEVNHNFKVALGNVIPGGSPDKRKRVNCGDNKSRSAYEVTKDFLITLIETTIQPSSESRDQFKFIVAEPLSLQHESTDRNWLKNYRDNIRRILHGYNVDFLPEPFAVYQYYRYGLRIPHVSGADKHIALIVDFGGGTFDASIIETTKTGDISESGKHAKPLASDSVPVGGFYLNQVLAEYLLMRERDKPTKQKIRKALDNLDRIQKGELAFSQIRDESRHIIDCYELLKGRVEEVKIRLCEKISDWTLESPDYSHVAVDLPYDPTDKESSWFQSDLYSHELRDVFQSKLWNPNIKPALKNVLDRASDGLKGRAITVTLLSGGSSNVRYLHKLIDRDFADSLGTARPVAISASFQEVVAKGLAIECARRNYDDEAEFVSVTYNPIKLFLGADEEVLEKCKFESVDNKIDMARCQEADILPSAQDISHFIDEPVQWRFRLSRAPKHRLRYYFTRPAMGVPESDNVDRHAIYNVGTVLHTPRNASFDSKLRVELTLQEDGTARPRFVYKTGSDAHGVPETAVDGEPFVLDVTSVAEAAPSHGYVGLDFGTSTSSLCRIDNRQIGLVEQRSHSPEWKELQELCETLPHPVAYPLRKYLAVNRYENATDRAIEAYEAALAFAAYTVLAEILSQGRSIDKLLRDFAHRSIGPLKNVLEKGLRDLGQECTFSGTYRQLVNEFKENVERARYEFNEYKHRKMEAGEVRAREHLITICNVVENANRRCWFGYFEYLEKKGMVGNSYEGVFRLAHGLQPFARSMKYNGNVSLNRDMAVLVSEASEKMLVMVPFYLFSDTQEPDIMRECYVLDNIEGAGASYKNVRVSKRSGSDDLGSDVQQVVSVVQSDKAASVDIWKLGEGVEMEFDEIDAEVQ